MFRFCLSNNQLKHVFRCDSQVSFGYTIIRVDESELCKSTHFCNRVGFQWIYIYFAVFCQFRKFWPILIPMAAGQRPAGLLLGPTYLSVSVHSQHPVLLFPWLQVGILDRTWMVSFVHILENCRMIFYLWIFPPSAMPLPLYWFFLSQKYAHFGIRDVIYLDLFPSIWSLLTFYLQNLNKPHRTTHQQSKRDFLTAYFFRILPNVDPRE